MDVRNPVPPKTLPIGALLTCPQHDGRKHFVSFLPPTSTEAGIQKGFL